MKLNICLAQPKVLAQSSALAALCTLAFSPLAKYDNLDLATFLTLPLITIHLPIPNLTSYTNLLFHSLVQKYDYFRC
ncbi:unnamed protein product [Brugia timori]|uniref:Ovule protein n=1 Tax=Brugia timori TaxID=42155 RepID=A0A0R3Q8S6_9BILA|nr:unnamed protein product [Brugia timori]